MGTLRGNDVVLTSMQCHQVAHLSIIIITIIIIISYYYYKLALPLVQEGQLSVTSESMYKYFWLIA